MRKHVFGISDQVRHKPQMARGWKIRIKVVEGLYYLNVCSENKDDQLQLGSNTAQLICAFVFAYAKGRFFMTQLIF